MRAPTRWLAAGVVLTSPLALGPVDGPPPAPGGLVARGELRRLRPFLPREIWRLRDHFFFEDMQLRIAPRGDYTPARAYVAENVKSSRGAASVKSSAKTTHSSSAGSIGR